MRKIYLLLLFLLCSIGYMQAQAWLVYDGGHLPADKSDSVFNRSTVLSSNNPGAHFIGSIVNDPEIAGNKYFLYVQPDDKSAADASIQARTQYRSNFAATYNDATSTVVLRAKGFKIDSLPEASVFNFEYQNGKKNKRENVYMFASDSSIYLQYANVKVKVPYDLYRWHMYRVSVTLDTIKVFIDESSTAVISAKIVGTTGASNNYWRFGDGGKTLPAGAQLVGYEKVAGYCDWIALDTTGAYAPGQGVALPAELSQAVNTVNLPGAGKKVLFLTQKELKDPNGFYADSMFVVDLQAAGFLVDVAYDDYELMSYDKAQLLLAYNCVIIGRGTTSGDFAGADDIWWRKTTVPVILMSNNHVGYNKMNWMPGTTAAKTDNAARLEGPIQGKVLDPQDNAFAGLVIPTTDSTIDYIYNNVGLVTLNAAEVASLNAEILISLTNGPIGYDVSTTTGANLDTLDLSAYDGTVLMARWAPLDTMYDGGSVVNFGWRSFITGGDDHDYVAGMDKKRAFYVFSPEMNQVLINEILALDALEPATISDDNTLSSLTASVGTIDPVFAPAVTKYTVTVPKGTTQTTISATANDPKATVEGTGVFTVPSSDTITVTSEAGTPNYILIIVMEEVEVPVAGLVPPGEGTLELAVELAEDGDTLFLENGEEYILIDPITLTKSLVIRAVEYPTLPLLENMPVVLNDYGLESMIIMGDGGKLELIGVDMDGADAALRVISLRTKKAHMEIKINRCRIHNSTGDLIGGSKADSSNVDGFSIKNSFLYNTNAHGAYIKDVWVKEGATYKWEDITYWNLGQQLVWLQNFSTTGHQQVYTFNHMTGYYLGVNEADQKELIGNSDANGWYNITLTNSIMSTQINTTQPSLMFSTVSPLGTNTFDIRNIVLFDVNEVKPRDGSADITITNLLEDDPEFADPDNGDFTIGNEAYLTAADNDTVVGARYWHPDFVDAMCDVKDCGATGIDFVKTNGVSVEVYPNPFTTEVSFKISLEKAASVSISITDISGRLVKVINDELEAGANRVSINAAELNAGAYFYTVKAGENSTSGNLLKTN